MKTLETVENFGGTDADSDDLLLQAFQDHEAYVDILSLKRHLILGKKGSGKTAIFKKLITTRSPNFFSFGHTFSDYPWHYHERQARIGIPEFDKYTHSWKYLILMSAAKLVLNQDNSIPVDSSAMDDMVRLESFVVDTYGSRDPDLAQIFLPTRHLRIKPHFALDFKVLKAGIAPESVPISELPTIVQEVNKVVQETLLRCLNPKHTYMIAFDQLDLGFETDSQEYKSRLIGLLLACRDLNIAAKQSDARLFTVVFLRDDIYDILHFEDKNKMTENYASRIEWDTSRTKKTLKSLMENRFSILLSEGDAPERVSWESVFNETREMPGRQTKYDHICDRTYLRPRDMIKFANSALARFKERIASVDQSKDDDSSKIDNVDVHDARPDFSEYFLSEMDDEIHKHLPKYERYLDSLRTLGKWQFDKTELEQAVLQQLPNEGQRLAEIIEELYNFSVVGFYKAGGRGFGGSEYVFRYRESKTRFDPTAVRLRVHPGLIEVLGLRRSQL